jgi:hypothetical protein
MVISRNAARGNKKQLMCVFSLTVKMATFWFMSVTLKNLFNFHLWPVFVEVKIYATV